MDLSDHIAPIILLIPFSFLNLMYFLGYKLYLYLIGFAYSNSVLYCYIAFNTFMMFVESLFLYNSSIFKYNGCEPIAIEMVLSVWNFFISLISLTLVQLAKDHVRTEAGFFINLISFFLTVPAFFSVIALMYKQNKCNDERERKGRFYYKVFAIPLLINRCFFYLYPGLTYYFFYSYYYNLALWPLLLAVPALFVVYNWSFELWKERKQHSMVEFPIFFYYFWFVNNIYQVFTLILSIFFENNDVIINK